MMRFLLAAAAALTLSASAAPSRPQLIINEIVTAVEDAAFPRPGPPPVIDLSKYTIAQILNWTLHHPETKPGEPGHPPEHRLPFPGREHRRTLPLHKLAFVVDKLDGIKAILGDEKANLTLFAPDDYGLPDGPHHRHGSDDEDAQESTAVFSELVGAMETLEEDGDDKDREERKRKFLKLAEIILKYHVAPDGAYTGRELADASTLVTALPYSRAEGSDRFRVRIRPTLFPRPSLVINFYARARLEVQAKNGRIHLISAPLLPPLSHLSEAFLFPQVFSTLTSAVQKVELDEVLAPWLHHHDDDHKVNDVVHEVLAELLAEREAKEGKATFTVIAPTNFAFKKLGFKINAFLFSPFGRSILKDVLSYHVVPKVAFFSDYVNGLPPAFEEDVMVDLPALEAEGEELSVFEPPHPPHGPMPPHIPLPGKRHPKDPEHDHPPHHGPHEPHRGGAKVYHWTLPTLLGNQTIGADVYVYRLGLGKGPYARRVVFRPAVGDEVYAFAADVPVWGGAIHAVNTLLRPELKHHEHGHRFNGEL